MKIDRKFGVWSPSLRVMGERFVAKNYYPISLFLLSVKSLKKALKY